MKTYNNTDWTKLSSYEKRTYTIPCKGDVCQGDEIIFQREVWGDNWRKPEFLGYELKKGKIIKDSYGATTGQHTFTIKVRGGKTFRIKGRNIHKFFVYRKAWKNEQDRVEILEEKHERGSNVRNMKQMRREIW